MATPDDHLFEVFEERKLKKTKKKLVRDLWNQRMVIETASETRLLLYNELKELQDIAKEAVDNLQARQDEVERLQRLIIAMCESQVN